MKKTMLISLFVLVLALFLGCSQGGASDGDTQASDIGAAAAKDYHAEWPIFYYGEKSFDVTEQQPSINAITDIIPVGDKLVLECHVGPKNGVYCIFDTASEDFVRIIMGVCLTWHDDDIETAVYGFWSDVCDYNGNVIKSYELSELEYIYAIEFSEDNTSIIVTISNEDGDRTDVIELDS